MAFLVVTGLTGAVIALIVVPLHLPWAPACPMDPALLDRP